MKKKPLTNKEGEVRPLTRADFKRARPMRKVLPKIAAEYRKSGGRPAGSTKTPVSIRLDNDTIDFFKSKGAGWQTRIGDVLRFFVHVAQDGNNHQ